MTSPSPAPPRRKPAAAVKPRSRRASTPIEEGTAAVEPGLVDQVRAMAGRLLDLSTAAGMAGRALQTAGRVSQALREGQALEAASEVVKAVLPGIGGAGTSAAQTGAALRAMREAAGMTMADVGAAIDLQDPALIDALENGRIALSFELFLRLAAVFGRSDPIGFVMGLTRAASPDLWHSLETLGVGKLVLQTVREHQFVNLLRSNDDARSLSDEEFAELLSFTQAAFEMAMAWRKRQHGERATQSINPAEG